MTESSEKSSTVLWTEVRVLVPVGWQELVADVLSELLPDAGMVFGATSIAAPEAPEGTDWLRTYVTRDRDDAALRAALDERLARLASIAPELADLSASFRPVPPEDWATSWRKSWKPFRVRRLCVLPPWRAEGEGAAPRPGDRVLRLAPGGAFGSGRHATTRTCLVVLQERIRGGERVLDAGSGSGILAVTATLLGARSALGFDVQREARAYAEELAEANGVADRCTFRTGGFETLHEDERGLDVVLANIYSDVIQEHARELTARLAPGGWFAFSGCPVHHVQATRAAIQAAGLVLEEDRARGRWHTFVGHRP